jgi:hypothetical protein
VARTVLRGDRRSNAAVLPDNKNHYVRDTVWHEDAQHINNGTAPHVKATLTNTANSLLRLHGHTEITRTTEWISRDPHRALPLLATQRN